MKIEIRARPAHWSMPSKAGFDKFAAVRYADEITDQGQIGVKVGLVVMAAIDNMRKSGEDALDPHWSILVTFRKVEREDGTNPGQ